MPQGDNTTAREHAEKVLSLVTLIDYNLYKVLAEHHINSKILSCLTTLYGNQAVGGFQKLWQDRIVAAIQNFKVKEWDRSCQ